MKLVQVQRIGCAPKHSHQGIAIAMRHLGGAVEAQHVEPRIVSADRAARFHRHRRMPAELQIEFDHRVRVGERAIHIAVAMAEHRRRGGVSLVELGRRIRRRQQDRQRIDLEANEIRRILSHVGIGGKHRRNRLADVTHSLARQHGLTVAQQRLGGGIAKIDRRDVADVRAGPHRNDTRNGQSFPGINSCDAAVGNRRPHQAHMQLERQRHVRDEAARPRHQSNVLKPIDRLPNCHRKSLP